MDFDFSEDQQMLMTAFEGLLAPWTQAPQGLHGYTVYSAELQAEIAAAGFMEIAAQPGFGLLDAALLVEAGAACPVSVELASSMMIAPLLSGVEGPLAVASALGQPVRYLPVAQSVCLFHDGDVWQALFASAQIEVLDSVAAYPLGRLARVPDGANKLGSDLTDKIRRRALIGIAAEAAGLMRGATDCTVAYVRERQQFGQPLGHFQAIQHRLAESAQLARACRWLAFRAADTGSESDAATACLYAQESMRKVITDCHQFTGAMGLTLEWPLHLWTYRMKVLQGEFGGKGAQARRLAQAVWPETAVKAAALPEMAM